jgi:hypothetical protein
MVLFTLLAFSSVAVSDFLEEVLNVAKCIADIHQELPNSCVFIITSEVEVQGEEILFFSSQFFLFGKNVLRFCVIKLRKVTWKYIFGNNMIWINQSNRNCLDLDGVFQLS